jgi:hypothetical protein
MLRKNTFTVQFRMLSYSLSLSLGIKSYETTVVLVVLIFFAFGSWNPVTSVFGKWHLFYYPFKFAVLFSGFGF